MAGKDQQQRFGGAGAAGRAASVRWVLTVWPAALRTVQVTVIGRASTNDRVADLARASPSCGKKMLLDEATARSAAMRSIVRSTQAPVLPATSRGATLIV